MYAYMYLQCVCVCVCSKHQLTGRKDYPVFSAVKISYRIHNGFNILFYKNKINNALRDF